MMYVSFLLCTFTRILHSLTKVLFIIFFMFQNIKALLLTNYVCVEHRHVLVRLLNTYIKQLLQRHKEDETFSPKQKTVRLVR